MLGATGAIYAIRRELWRPLPPGTLLDDFLTPMRIVLAGRRAIFDDRAVALRPGLDPQLAGIQAQGAHARRQTIRPWPPSRAAFPLDQSVDMVSALVAQALPAGGALGAGGDADRVARRSRAVSMRWRRSGRPPSTAWRWRVGGPSSGESAGSPAWSVWPTLSRCSTSRLPVGCWLGSKDEGVR